AVGHGPGPAVLGARARRPGRASGRWRLAVDPAADLRHELVDRELLVDRVEDAGGAAAALDRELPGRPSQRSQAHGQRAIDDPGPDAAAWPVGDSLADE